MPYRTLAGLFKKESDQVDKKELLVQKILSVPVEDWKDENEGKGCFHIKDIFIDLKGNVARNNCGRLYPILKNRKIKKLARQVSKARLNKYKQREKEIEALNKERDLDYLLKEL